MTAQEKQSNLTSLLYPNSVAVTGASNNPEDLGSYILRNIIFSEFKERVFPVSSKVRELYNFDAYSSIREIKEDVDLAIIASDADRVIDDIYDCTRSRVKNICVASRGFAETGQTGLMLQKKIKRMANEAGIRILGPNSLGVISTSQSLNATFGPGMPQGGKAVFLSQSGALINALIEYSKYYSFGLAEIVGLGNKSDLCELDFIEYYASIREDGRPGVLGCYLENIANGEEFLEGTPRLTKSIPLIVLIPAGSDKTEEYIYSHSGSIVQKEEVIDLALKRSGALRAYTQQQLYDLMLAFLWQVVPRGNNVAVISNAGGGLILAIDEIYRRGLKLVSFPTDIKKLLMQELDWKGRSSGVVDLGGDALALNYLKALDIVLGCHDVNAVVVILSRQIMTEIESSAESIGRLSKQHGKTVVAAFMGYEDVEKGIKALSKYFIPAFNSPDRAIYVLSRMYDYFKLKEKGGPVLSKFLYPTPLEEKKSVKVLEIIERARVEKRVDLGLDQCIQILNNYDVNTENIIEIRSLKDVIEFGDKFAYPIDFYCLSKKRALIINNKGLAKQVFEEHFKKHREDKSHKFCDHLVKRVFKSKKAFKFLIQKDTYYNHVDKGFTVKELSKLSVGYCFEMGVEGFQLSSPIIGLLPISREELEEKLLVSGLLEGFGLRRGKRYDEFKSNLISFIQKVIRVPLDFSQVAGLEMDCVADKGKIFIVDCNIKLDLVI